MNNEKSTWSWNHERNLDIQFQYWILQNFNVIGLQFLLGFDLLSQVMSIDLLILMNIMIWLSLEARENSPLLWSSFVFIEVQKSNLTREEIQLLVNVCSNWNCTVGPLFYPTPPCWEMSHDRAAWAFGSRQFFSMIFTRSHPPNF